MLVCGVDEAGRGPVIGPLAMAGIALGKAAAESLRSLGVKDSKLLTVEKMRSLRQPIVAAASGFHLVLIQPAEIDAAVQSDSSNLNWLEAAHCSAIINRLAPGRAIVDCPSPNTAAYARYLRSLLDDKSMELVVEHKADFNHIECSAASILAKVAREDAIQEVKEKLGIDFGSGYLTDPKTQQFLKENFESNSDIFRKSWLPYRQAVAAKFQSRLSDF
ncbi:ribonuclease HII [Candidatus Woesearchaeota archaeon]|nr:ribonuclease HII [Candidatus Woesearchaeota archaeon]